jgi:hypothetical protein
LKPTTPLGKVGLEIDKEESQNLSNADNRSVHTLKNQNSGFILMKHDASGIGPDLLDM